MSVKASNKAFISHHIKLDFFNDSNRKTDTQNRISNETEINFKKALENIQGDNKETEGVSFSELTLLAMAYFYERLFPENIQAKDADYSINSVKGYFDACNHTSYTAINEVDTTYYNLRDSALFNACYLVIQTAWFFNSEHFGSHQHITYVNHYAETRTKLPESDYKHDLEYLHKKYNDIDEGNIKGVYGYAMVNQWYYFILFFVVSELKLSIANFKISEKRFRVYNPFVKCSRMLRRLTPFKIVECDIKSAFPSFIDFLIKGNKGHKVYANLQKNHNINRSQAKILFNTWCNSGKYKTISATNKFFRSCGYTDSECNIITSITHSKITTFYDVMCEYEKTYIDRFMDYNQHLNGARLHDAVLYIDKNVKPSHLVFDVKCVFGLSNLNKPIYTNSFKYSNKGLRYAYVSSLPPATEGEFKPLAKKQILTKPKVKGEANGFRFFTSKYKYITASFDISVVYTYDEFINNCIQMLSTLNYLNDAPITKTQLLLFIRHIRRNSNTIFNVRYLFKHLCKHLNSVNDVIIMDSDFEFTERITFRRKIDFLIAYNTAKGIVNQNHRMYGLYELLKYRISKNDYSFIDYKMNGKKSTNILAKAILLKINMLSTNYQRKPKIETVKSNPLYSIMYKEGISYVILSTKTTRPTRRIRTYETELLRINRLINNRKIVDQYIHILSELTGIEYDGGIIKKTEIIQAEKKYLIEQTLGDTYKTIKQGAKAFDKSYLPIKEVKIQNHTPTLDDFDTSMKHSVFNNIDDEDAYYRGAQFFEEYLKFHKMDEENKEVQVVKKKNIIVIPEFDFDG